MYQAGFRWILVGFESGSPRILTKINKKASLDDNTRCIEIARRHGLKVKALMSMGHPGECEETALQTHQWLVDVAPDDFDVTIITTYPGTPYHDQAIPHRHAWPLDLHLHQDRGWLHITELDYMKVADDDKGDPDGGYRAFVWTDALSSDDLVAFATLSSAMAAPAWGFHLIPARPLSGSSTRWVSSAPAAAHHAQEESGTKRAVTRMTLARSNLEPSKQRPYGRGLTTETSHEARTAETRANMNRPI